MVGGRRRHRGGDIGQELASLGRFVATVGIVVCLIIGIPLAAFGIYEIAEKDPWVSASATVETVQCRQDESRACSCTATYEVAGKSYTSTVDPVGSGVKVGDSIKVRYGQADPAQITTDSPAWIAGSIMLSVGLIVMLAGLL
jgi:Na+/glutamate symporter